MASNNLSRGESLLEEHVKDTKVKLAKHSKEVLEPMFEEASHKERNSKRIAAGSFALLGLSVFGLYLMGPEANHIHQYVRDAMYATPFLSVAGFFFGAERYAYHSERKHLIYTQKNLLGDWRLNLDEIHGHYNCEQMQRKME